MECVDSQAKDDTPPGLGFRVGTRIVAGSTIAATGCPMRAAEPVGHSPRGEAALSTEGQRACGADAGRGITGAAVAARAAECSKRGVGSRERGGTRRAKGGRRRPAGGQNGAASSAVPEGSKNPARSSRGGADEDRAHGCRVRRSALMGSPPPDGGHGSGARIRPRDTDWEADDAQERKRQAQRVQPGQSSILVAVRLRPLLKHDREQVQVAKVPRARSCTPLSPPSFPPFPPPPWSSSTRTSR